MKTRNDFKIYDRVVAICDGPSDNDNIKSGMSGIILDISRDSPQIGVCWDVNVHGHVLNGLCERGYGWYVEPSEIEHPRDFPEEDPFSVSESDLDALFTNL